MPDPLRIFTAITMGVAALIMLDLAVLAYLRSRRTGEDVLRSAMFLKAHLLRRGYFLIIFASIGLLLLGIPLALEANIPSAYYAGAAVLVMGSLDLAVLYFYSLVAPQESPLGRQLARLAKLLEGVRRHERGRDAE